VVAALIALVVVTIVMLLAQLASDAAFDLQIDAGFLASTIVLSGLLAAFHGSLAVAVAGIRGRPSLVLAIGLGVAFAGLIANSLFPLSDVLAPWRHLSPWDWAFGGNPLKNPTELWRYAALAVPSAMLTGVGVFAVARRDISGA
jgi:ABC-2 type transport system permease protein